MSATAKGLFTAEGALVAALLLLLVLVAVGTWPVTRLASPADAAVFRA